MTKDFDIFDILIGKENDKDYKKKSVIIQGITGSYGSTHTRLMKAYGTNIVAGVTPGKEGQNFEGIPVYNMWLRQSKHQEPEYLEYLFQRTFS